MGPTAVQHTLRVEERHRPCHRLPATRGSFRVPLTDRGTLGAIGHRAAAANGKGARPTESAPAPPPDSQLPRNAPPHGDSSLASARLDVRLLFQLHPRRCAELSISVQLRDISV